MKKAVNRRKLKQLDQRNLNLHVLTDMLMNLHEEKRMASEIEEVVVSSDPLHVQDTSPDFGEPFFNLRLRSGVEDVEFRAAAFRSRQSISIDFSVWTEG